VVVPASLALGARNHVRTRGVRQEPRTLADHRDGWLAAGIPGELIDLVVAFEETWGVVRDRAAAVSLCHLLGTAAGPKYPDADVPGRAPGAGWCFVIGA
jgi:hypothetical protein